jgi:DNA-binding IclR family transcriptional regulator
VAKWSGERQNEVIELLSNQNGAGLTRRQIAEGLGLSKSPYIIRLLDDLEQKGYVGKQWDDSQYPPTFKYFLVAAVGE